MENTVNDRLNLMVTTFEKGKKSSFARTIGMSPQGVQSLLTGRQSEPGFEMLTRILKAYPQVSTDWLIFGQGEMLKGQQPEGAGLINQGMGQEPVSAATERENALLRQQVAYLTDMLDWVKGLVPAAVGKFLSSSDAAHHGRQPYGALAVGG